MKMTTLNRWSVPGVACAVSLLIVLPAAGWRSQPSTPTAFPGVGLVDALPDGEWRLPSGDHGSLRYSPLDAINATNVQRLRVITTMSTGVTRGHEGQP